MANVHVFAGITPRETLLDVLEGRAPLKQTITPGPEGVQIICGASGIHWIADLSSLHLENICRDLRDASEDYDILVLDTGAGISSQVMHFLGMANDIIVVTTPNLAATLDGYGLVKAAHETRLNGKVHLLINQVSGAQEASNVSTRITDCAQRFLGAAPAVLGYLARDHAVELANQARRPVLHCEPASEYVARLDEMALRLCGAPSPEHHTGAALDSTIPSSLESPDASFSNAVA